jgi:hypothetical protein
MGIFLVRRRSSIQAFRKLRSHSMARAFVYTIGFVALIGFIGSSGDLGIWLRSMVELELDCRAGEDPVHANCPSPPCGTTRT